MSTNIHEAKILAGVLLRKTLYHERLKWINKDIGK